MLTATFGYFDCPVCVDFYLIPDWKVKTMPLLSRVHVLCPPSQRSTLARFPQPTRRLKLLLGPAQPPRIIWRQ